MVQSHLHLPPFLLPPSEINGGNNLTEEGALWSASLAARVEELADPSCLTRIMVSFSAFNG